MSRVETVIVGPIHTNCYLAVQDTAALIIDPGANAEKISAEIALLGLTPAAIINTHGHWDHVMADNELKQLYKIPVYMPLKDKELLELEKDHYHIGDPQVDYWYTDKLENLNWPLKIIPTPGHTQGSSCLLWEKVLFSGDMMFAGGYLGRTDLWGGEPEKIQASLDKLLLLPDETIVYPGHAESSTIGAERRFYDKR